MEKCIDPTCFFSNYRKKCIRVNSYIESLAFCKRNNKDIKECKKNYKNNKEMERAMSCDRYRERLNIKKTPKCIEPKCHFSEYRKKCVKPNPYIETIAYCGRNDVKRPKCEIKYKENKDESIINSCKRHNERQTLNISKVKVQKKSKK